METHLNRDVRLRRPERKQVEMSMQCVDDLVAADHRVRMVWAVVGRLDLSGFYDAIGAVAGVAGRDSTDPKLLVSLLLYGSIKGIGSARELARRCESDAPFKWLCGGVSVNHHMLSDFRVDHAAALDGLFAEVLATLVHQKLVSVKRVSQDGTRIRAYVGMGSCRRKKSLDQLREEAVEHVREVRALIDDPAACGAWSSKKKAAKLRGAKDRQRRLDEALEELPKAVARQAAKKNGGKEPAEVRVSTTEAHTVVMKMPNGGFRPAHNVQIAVDPASRAIVGVDVVDTGVDTYQSEPMRRLIETITGEKVQEHLIDGGYLSHEQIERAEQEGVKVYVPPKPAKNKTEGVDQYTPRPADPPGIAAWRARMASDDAKTIYKQRASSVETVNADMKEHRGLGKLLVRGVKKVKCAAMWSALAYNLMHFGEQLLGA